MMHKKALVVVSFGTTYPDARRAIEALENRLARELPDFDCFRAFTSGRIIQKLKKEQNLHIPTPQEILEQLVQEGYREVVCQPLHILNGFEFEKMKRQILPFANRFFSLKMGAPLLTRQRDYTACCQILSAHMPALQEDETLVLMGHGTDHFSNAAYCQLEHTLRHLDMERVLLGTVEGFPDLEVVLKQLEKRQITKTVLMPFMIVAGDHAQNDLAGDGEDSWKSILERLGYEVDVILKGLGDFPETGDLFALHLQEALRSENLNSCAGTTGEVG